MRWIKVITQNKEDLKNFCFQVEDLELKVNILTYKVQYGTWPLPNYAKKKLKKKLHEAQCTFPKLKEKDYWTKHLFLR